MNRTEELPHVTHSPRQAALLASRAFWAAVYQSPHFKAVPVLHRVWNPCLLLLGGFGNVLTILVLRRMKDSHSSQHVFLGALAVADLCFLCSNVLINVIDYHFTVKLMALHSVPCKFFTWLYDVSTTLSAWLVTAVTVQRTLAVTWPHKIRVMCTVRRTWTVVAVLVIASCVLRLDGLVMYRVQRGRCFYEKTAIYVYFLVYINTWLDFTLRSLLPFACLLLCDVILSVSLFQATSVSSVASQAMSNAPSVHGDNSRRETAKRTTVTILAVSISFLLLTSPVQIVIMWHNGSAKQLTGNVKLTVVSYVVRNVTYLLMSTNSAINFVLYCLTGTRFRKELLSLICCGVTDHSSRSVGKTAGGLSKGERTNPATHRSDDVP